jgi:hypothetical protein
LLGFPGAKKSPELKDGVIREKMLKKGKFLNVLSLKHAKLEKMKKGENGWLLQQQEDGESHNTFSWTGWMIG